MSRKKRIQAGLLFFIALILVNVLATLGFTRFDLTADQRYTLSLASREIIEDVKGPMIIDVFLEGELPPEFRRLRNETRQMLEEFAAYNPHIRFNFIDPLEAQEDAEEIAGEFHRMGMSPARVSTQENGRSSQAMVFPWAMANLGNKSVSIPLLKNNLGASEQQRVTNSVQQLEYVFADGLSKLIYPREKKIAVMRGNGELPDSRIADFIRSLQEYYLVAPFTLDSAAVSPERTLEALREYDLILEAKPTVPFTEKEKYLLDQYTMDGGKSLWLTETIAMETDSLFNTTGTALAFPRDLNLGDFFFSYGIRINPFLINDVYSAPIILASGQGSNTRFNPYPWFYSPLSSSPNDHPIINNLEAVKFDYANPIDTLKNQVTKTILLSSSPRTKLEGAPREISLEMVQMEPDLTTYNDGEQPLAVLLEGKFPSVYRNRIKPFDLEQDREESLPTSMLVISDGDVIKNELRGGEAVELGFDRYTGNVYGNKEFLMNAVNYLLDDSGLVDIRSKEISIAFLDPERTGDQRQQWQLINLISPLVLLVLFGFLFRFYRQKKYRR